MLRTPLRRPLLKPLRQTELWQRFRRWWAKNAVATFDFFNDLYQLDGQAISRDMAINCDRPFPALARDANGIWRIFGPDEPRLANGLLVEPAGTYFPTNSNLTGAQIGPVGNGGLLPEGWLAGAGDYYVLALGQSYGLPHIDIGIEYANNTGGVQYISLGNGETSGLQTGDDVTHSVFMQRLSGDGSIGYYSLYARENNGSGPNKFTSTDIPDNLEKITRVELPWTLSVVDLVDITTWFLGITVPAGESIDITMRFWVPQFESGLVDTAPVLTNATGVLERPADIITENDIATTLAGLNEGIVVCKFNLPKGYTGTSYPRLVSISDGTTDNVIELFTAQAGSLKLYVRKNAGSAIDVSILNPFVPGDYTVAIGLYSDGRIGASVNGSDGYESPPNSIPDLQAMNRFVQGGRANLSVEITSTAGFTEAIKTTPTAALLQQLSAVL